MSVLRAGPASERGSPRRATARARRTSCTLRGREASSASRRQRVRSTRRRHRRRMVPTDQRPAASQRTPRKSRLDPGSGRPRALISALRPPVRSPMGSCPRDLSVSGQSQSPRTRRVRPRESMWQGAGPTCAGHAQPSWLRPYVEVIASCSDIQRLLLQSASAPHHGAPPFLILGSSPEKAISSVFSCNQPVRQSWGTSVSQTVCPAISSVFSCNQPVRHTMGHLRFHPWVQSVGHGRPNGGRICVSSDIQRLLLQSASAPHHGAPPCFILGSSPLVMDDLTGA